MTVPLSQSTPRLACTCTQIQLGRRHGFNEGDELLGLEQPKLNQTHVSCDQIAFKEIQLSDYFETNY